MNFSNLRQSTFENGFILAKPTKSRIKLQELKQKVFWNVILNALQLVDIGYYHVQKGVTTCFACGFTVGNWELNDDPIDKPHLSSCYWYNWIYNAHHGLWDRPENLEYRLASFQNGWIREGSLAKMEVIQ